MFDISARASSRLTSLIGGFEVQEVVVQTIGEGNKQLSPCPARSFWGRMLHKCPDERLHNWRENETGRLGFPAQAFADYTWPGN